MVVLPDLSFTLFFRERVVKLMRGFQCTMARRKFQAWTAAILQNEAKVGLMWPLGNRIPMVDRGRRLVFNVELGTIDVNAT